MILNVIHNHKNRAIFMTLLQNLIPELLLNIFQNLELCDLLNLKVTCSKFRSLINTYWEHILVGHVKPIVSNQIDKIIIERSQRILSPFEKHRICHNWQRGRYKEKNLLKTSKEKFLPCLQLQKNYIWISRGKFIRSYVRKSKNVNVSVPFHTICGKMTSDISKFIIRDELLLSCSSNGMWLFSLEENRLLIDIHNPEMETTCIDMLSDVIVTGSRNHALSVYQNDGYKTLSKKYCRRMNDRIWSICAKETHIAIGTAANNDNSSIFLIDIEKNHIVTTVGTENFGAGILDLKWDGASILWSGGYDSTLRKWDMRSGKCVQIFHDPFRATIYSLECDYVNTVITGCESHGRVVLWDTRKDKYVQMYYMDSCRRSSSPIYSLSFDAEQLFTATDQHLNILNFSILQGHVRDYSNLFKIQING